MKFRILVALAVVGLFTAEASAFGRRHRGGCNTGCQTVAQPTCSQATYVPQQTVYFGGCSTCTAAQPWTPVRSTINALSPVTLFPNCTNGICTVPNTVVVPATNTGPQIVPAPNR